jgi:hypothetical protein
VEKIFDTPIQYRVPLYQRPYVWKRDIDDPSEDRLTPFWEDARGTVSRYLKRQEHIAQGVDEHELVAFTDHFWDSSPFGGDLGGVWWSAVDLAAAGPRPAIVAIHRSRSPGQAAESPAIAGFTMIVRVAVAAA